MNKEQALNRLGTSGELWSRWYQQAVLGSAMTVLGSDRVICSDVPPALVSCLSLLAIESTIPAEE